MKKSMMNTRAKVVALLIVGVTVFLPAFAGGDSYRIFLNGKMVMTQYVTQPLSLSSLPLSEANSKDELVVYYSHCGAIGKERSITIKDEKGTVLKEWKFADADNQKDVGMHIPVKDI